MARCHCTSSLLNTRMTLKWSRPLGRLELILVTLSFKKARLPFLRLLLHSLVKKARVDGVRLNLCLWKPPTSSAAHLEQLSTSSSVELKPFVKWASIRRMSLQHKGGTGKRRRQR